MRRRTLSVGPDGKADVMVLTDPIPRHLSLVSWGANDRPAQSWMSAAGTDALKAKLRAPPDETVMDVGQLTLDSLKSFISETLDAWNATVMAVLAEPISAPERAARIRALTSQAGARVAAIVAGVPSDRLQAATSSYKVAGLKLPAPQTSSTLQGELDRRAFAAALQTAAAALMDKVCAAMKDPTSTGCSSSTEAVLGYFGDAGGLFSDWAVSMPDGIVGVPEGMASKPGASAMSGRRHSAADLEKIEKIRQLLAELDPEGSKPAPEASTKVQERNMSITAADLQKIATEDPKAFIAAFRSAEAALIKTMGPTEAKKFGYGDTGVEQYDSEAIIAGLKRIQDSTQFIGLIAKAVGGIDVNSAVTDGGVQVAQTMRSALAKFVTAELKANPNGELATAVKEAIAESVSKSVVETVRALIPRSDPAGSLGDIGDFAPQGEASIEDLLAPVMPGSGNRAGR